MREITEAIRNKEAIGIEQKESISHFRVFLNVHHGGDGDTEIRGWAPEIWTELQSQRLSIALANRT
jgi:hypothetical protein